MGVIVTGKSADHSSTETTTHLIAITQNNEAQQTGNCFDMSVIMVNTYWGGPVQNHNQRIVIRHSLVSFLFTPTLHVHWAGVSQLVY